MVRVLVNGVSSRSGGGLVILRGYTDALARLTASGFDAEYFVAPPYPFARTMPQTPGLRVLELDSSGGRAFLARFYALELPRLVREHRIDVIVNLADLIVPMRTPQLYFFDWAYLVYRRDRALWSRLSLSARVSRGFKAATIWSLLPFATRTVAQTMTMAVRFRDEVGRELPTVIPTPTDIAIQRRPWIPHSGAIRLLCLANQAPHKNIDILVAVARILNDRGVDVRFALTLDRAAAKPILARAVNAGVADRVFNIGSVERGALERTIRSFDGVIIPSLLETYCLPFVEAMACGVTVLAPNRDFARDVCKGAAFYFDPTIPDSVADSIREAFSDADDRRQRVELGYEIAARLPSWDEFARAMHNEALEAIHAKNRST